MVVAFTSIGLASDILIREVKGLEVQYHVEIRRELKVQYDTSFGKDYEAAEKLYESLLEEYGGVVDEAQD